MPRPCTTDTSSIILYVYWLQLYLISDVFSALFNSSGSVETCTVALLSVMNLA